MGHRRRRRRGEIRPTGMPPPRHVPALLEDLVEEILIRCPPDDPAGEIRPTIMAPPRHVPALVDDLIEEILIRCPPDDPAVLVRAAVVYKDWRRVVSGPGFRRRFCELHRTAPMLGFLYYGGTPFRFEPTTSFRPRYASVDIGVLSALDARHGRVLVSRFSSVSVREDLVVWDPVRGDLQVLPMPRLRYTCRSWTAALLCAAAGCDHLDCAREPFRVVFVGTRTNGVVESSVCACIYSSVHGEWSKPTSVHHHSREDSMGNGPGALVGNALYFLFQPATGILKYDLGTGEVSVIHLGFAFYKPKMIVLTGAEEGLLGLASIYGSTLVVWSREASSNRDFAWLQNWVKIRVIELKALVPAEAFLVSPKVVGLADGVGVVILRTHGGLFAVDIKSSRVRKIGNGLTNYDVIAYMNFHTPVLQTASSDVVPRLCGSTASQTDGAH